MKLNSKGDSKLGCILSVLVLAAAIWCAYKIIPPYYNATSFFDEVESKVREAANNRRMEKDLEKNIYLLADRYEQPSAAENPRETMHVNVAIGGQSIAVDIKYKLHIDLGVYEFDWPQDRRITSQRLRF
ncbi:MAG: hypothetical protein JXQ27_17550 [Acidobacteria bacterium]|nr:hypothetical protein [Acidobacteriota bacterium]